MKNFILGIIVVVVIIGGVVVWYRLKKNPTPSVSQSTATKPALSENPDRAVFNQYLTKISLNKLPSGETLSGPTSAPESSVFNFSAGDKFCTGLSVIKEIPQNSYANAVYDTNTKSYVIPRHTSPRAVVIGNNMGCEDLLIGPSKLLSSGKYEYKAYIDGVLVAVLPFEVQ